MKAYFVEFVFYVLFLPKVLLQHFIVIVILFSMYFTATIVV